MAMEEVWEFRRRIDVDAALADEVKAELAKRSHRDLPAVARRYGFNITDDELELAWAEMRDGELTPFELDLVSAGAQSSYTSSKDTGGHA